MAAAPTFVVRPISDAAALRGCASLQVRIWGMDDAEVVPHHQLVAAVSAGGIVLGGFDEDGTLVGFSYGLPGWRNRRILLYSHMTGVLAPYRSAGLGFRLKCAQREAALAAGIDHIVWTYDPLQAGNARFNLARLGAVAARYHSDYYGAMTDAINRGLPSDRFEVDWFLRSPRVEARLAGAPPPELNGNTPWALAAEDPDRGTAAAPAPPRLSLTDPQLLVEIPGDLARLKAEAPEIALAWRQATRTALQCLLARGYQAVEAGEVVGTGQGRTAYLLARETLGGAGP